MLGHQISDRPAEDGGAERPAVVLGLQQGLLVGIGEEPALDNGRRIGMTVQHKPTLGYCGACKCISANDCIINLLP